MNPTSLQGEKTKCPFTGLSRHVILPVSLLSQLLTSRSNNDSDENCNDFIFHLSK